MTETLLMMFSLGLHLAAISGLAYISAMIHSGNFQEAVITSFITAFCILVPAWSLAKAKSWLDG